jgi:hypothetical protein
MKNYKTIIAVAALGLACTALTSKAALVTLNPNTSVDISGATGYTLGGGATLIATQVSAYTTPSGDAGTLTTYVYSGDANNPLQGLTFVYNEVLTAGDLSQIQLNGFSSTVDVANMSGNVAPKAAFTQNSGASYIKFLWNPDGLGVGAPINSTVVVATGSLTYGGIIAGVSDGTTANVPILAPVPEPSTVVAGILMLLPFGIGAVRSLRKERA